jgi:Rne/Rng family ribonuclease
MSTELIVNASLPETRISLMEDGEIQELLIERATGKGIVGNIYKGRVTRVLPGMQAAFVDIGLEKAAFLYVDDVYVHSEIWADEEGESSDSQVVVAAGAGGEIISENSGETQEGASESDAADEDQSNGNQAQDAGESMEESAYDEAEEALTQHPELLSEEEAEEQMAQNLSEDEEEDEESEGGDEEDDDQGPAEMSAPPGGDDDEEPSGTVSPKANEAENEPEIEAEGEGENDASLDAGAVPGETSEQARKRRRGRRGGKNRRRGKDGKELAPREPRIPGKEVKTIGAKIPAAGSEEYPDTYQDQVSQSGGEGLESDRASMTAEGVTAGEGSDRPESQAATTGSAKIIAVQAGGSRRPEFSENRSKNRTIRPKNSTRPARGSVNIQDLLKEGQEVIVQIAKDPIATKGARLTCHISLPGRHLVCMPTIDHVGVSRRIERDEERRRLRDFVERNRPKKLGFIVRTATAAGKQESEVRIKQDIDYLTVLWEEIRDKANNVQAPALVYEDLNPVLRAIRDWVNEDIDKIVVDSRYHYNEIIRFVSHFMPGIKHKIDLYSGDIPIFDAYGISSELSRSLERKVWLKSGGYLVIDQAEALVAIDVNTGRYVGKKSLEDTILKTNLEAVREIAYQLRVRNCGGIIILDLIDMEKEENKFRVYRALEEELKKDRSRPQILKISELGLVEMTRKRTRDTMVRALCESCSHCEGKGYVKSKQTVAYEILRDIEREGIDRDVNKILIQAHPDVVDQLAIDERESLDQLERRYRKTVYLQAVADLHQDQFEVVTEKRTGAVRSDSEILDRARSSAGTTDGRDRGRRRDRERSNPNGKRGGRNDRGEKNVGDKSVGERQPRHDSRQSRNEGGGGKNRIQLQPQTNPNPNQMVIGGGAPASISSTPAAPIDEDSQAYQLAKLSARQAQIQTGNTIGNGPVQTQPTAEDDFFTEEDRLAFLRAQAAQDAALAGATPHGNRANTGQNRGGGKWSNNRGGGGAGGAGGGRNNRGGRNNNNRNRNNRPGGRFQGGFRDRPQGAGGPQITASSAPSIPSDSSGGGDFGGGGHGGGDDQG